MTHDAALPDISHNHFADLIGMQFARCERGHSRAYLEVEERLMNPNRVVHGGVIYTLADTSMGYALMSAIAADELCATIEIKISYYTPATAGQLVCDTKITHKTRRFAFLESEVKQGHHVVAKATGTFVISKARHEPPEAAAPKGL